MIKWMPGKLLCYTDFRSLKLPISRRGYWMSAKPLPPVLQALWRTYCLQKQAYGYCWPTHAKLQDVFPNIFSKAALAVLEKYPAPAHILKANRNKLIALIQKNSRRSLKWATAKYELLNSKAKEFAPLSISNSSNVAMLGVYISMIKTLEETLRKSSKPFVHWLLKIWQRTCHAGTDSRASTKHSRYRTYLCCYHSGWNWRLFSLSKPGKLVAYFGIDPL